MARPKGSAYPCPMDDDVRAFADAWMIDNAHVLFEIMSLENERRDLVYCAALTRFLTAHNARDDAQGS